MKPWNIYEITYTPGYGSSVAFFKLETPRSTFFLQKPSRSLASLHQAKSTQSLFFFFTFPLQNSIRPSILKVSLLDLHFICTQPNCTPVYIHPRCNGYVRDTARSPSGPGGAQIRVRPHYNDIYVTVRTPDHPVYQTDAQPIELCVTWWSLW